MEAKQKFTEQHKQKSAELEFQIFNLEEQLSSNINEVIRAVLNFLFFLPKDFTSTKSTKTLNQRTKIKNALKKHLREKQSLIRLFAFFVLFVCKTQYFYAHKNIQEEESRLFDVLCFLSFLCFLCFCAYKTSE